MTEVQERAALKVGELAGAAALPADAVRYYEKSGLLPPAERTPGGYRLYPDSAVDRIRFIQGCQRLGLRLAEIADLLSIRDTGQCPCEPAEALLRRRIAELDSELARLAALRADLAAMADRLPGGDCPEPLPGSWCPPALEAKDNAKEVERDACT